MKRMVRALGHPERAFASLLIAGTNGKGSVSAYLDAALRTTPLKVGRYTSPHLIDLRERITVDGADISRRDLDRLVLEVRRSAEREMRAGRIEQHPNHFEILTLVGFLYFREREVDVAVLEVGLGGRLDATNVANPLVSAIVSIDFDHEEYLGRTLAAIAREKAGVARRGRALVLGPVATEAREAIGAVARLRGARLLEARADVRVRRGARGLDIRTPTGLYRRLTPLQGAHQQTNLLVAIRALERFAEAGPRFDLPAAISAMSRATWPGRLERFAGHPPFLLDGAHNPAGARALARYLKDSRTRGVLVFGAMRDKHIEEMAAELFPRFRAIVATRVRMKRAALTPALAVLARRYGVAAAESPSVGEALKQAAALARRGETVVVAGSLYLVGAARRRLLAPRRS